MGFKPRKKLTNLYPPQEPVDAKVNVCLTRSDGYLCDIRGLSYQAGLAVSVIMNRAGHGLPVKVVWEEDGEEDSVEVPGL